MPPSKIATFLFALAAILLIWICLFIFHRQRRIDVLRLRLEALRDRLFDVAAASDAFTAPAVILLDAWLAQAISYAPHWTASRLLLFRLYRRSMPLQPQQQWEADRNAIAATEFRTTVAAIYSTFQGTLRNHMACASPLAWVLAASGFLRAEKMEWLIVNTTRLSILEPAPSSESSSAC